MRRFFSFKEPTQTYIAIEIIGDFVRVSAIESKHPSPHYTLLRSRYGQCAEREVAKYIAMLEQLIGEIKPPSNARYLLLLDRHLAATITASVTVKRENSDAPIAEAELDALAQEGVWKLLSRERAHVAQRMNVSEIDVQLTGAEIMKVLLDGHRVISPVGFTAQQITLAVRESVAHAPLLQALYKRIPYEHIMLTENTAGIAGSLLAHQGTGAALMVIVGALETEMYVLEQEHLRYVDRVAWGSSSLTTALSTALGISPAEVAPYIDIYTRKQASKHVLRALESVLAGELATVLQAIEVHGRMGHSVCMYSHYDLPGLLTDQKFHKRLGIKRTLVYIDDQFVSKNFGFTLNLNDIDIGTYSASSLVMSLAHMRRSRRTTIGHKAVERRVLWQQQNVS